MSLVVNADQPGFAFLFFDNPQPMWIFNTQTLQIVEVNNAAIKQYGYSRKEFLSKSISTLRPPEDIDELNRQLESLKEKHHDFDLKEFRHQDRDGNIFYVEVHSYKIIYNGMDCRLTHAHNVQQRKNIQQDLKNTRERLEAILDSINIGFCQVDHSQNITYWNTSMEELIGYHRKDVIGHQLWDVLPELVNTDFYNLLRWSIEKKESIEFIEYFWPLQKWFSVAANPTEYGHTIHLIDSTGKIQFQKSLLKKIEQLKDVSYLNSHLIRKPVASLMGLTNLIKEEIIEPSEFKSVAGYIFECSLELDEVVRQVNDKINVESKYEALQKELSVFSILYLLEEMRDEFDYSSLNQLEVVNKADHLKYYGNRQSIKAAVGCLINNSIKYSSLGSTIIIEADIIDHNLVISVHDFGVGIDNEMLNRLFLGLTHPEEFKNLGSGLALVAEVARSHHGTVWVESTRGMGSVFSLRFPLSNIAANIATGKADFSVYKIPAVEIDDNQTTDYLTANYKGFHDPYSVKAGGRKILDVLHQKDNAFRKLLIDDTELLGVWDGAIDWLTNEWFPQAEHAGVTRIAVIRSRSTFSRVSADNLVNNVRGKIKYRTFDERDQALEWLAQ